MGDHNEGIRTVVFKIIRGFVHLLCMVSGTQSSVITNKQNPVLSDHGHLDDRAWNMLP